MHGFTLSRRADARSTAAWIVGGLALLVLAYAAGAFAQPAPALRCALSSSER